MTLIRSAGLAAAFAAVLSLVALSSNASAAAKEDKEAQEMWKARCASCHGLDGKGNTEQGKKEGCKDMTSPEVQKEITDGMFKAAVKHGVKTDKADMPSSMDLTTEQKDALLKHFRSFKK